MAEKVFSKKYILITLKVVISVSLLAYCFTLVDLKELAEDLRHVSIFWFLLAVVMNVVGTIFIKSIVIWNLLSTDSRSDIFRIISINFAVRFYSLFLPKGASSAIRVFRYNQLTSNYASAFALFSFESLLTLILPTIGALIFIFIAGASHVPIFVIVTLMIFLFVLMLILAAFLSIPILNMLKNVCNSLREYSLFRKIYKYSDKLLSSDHGYRFSCKEQFPVTVLLSMFAYVLFLVNSLVLLKALNMEVAFTVISWIRSAVVILSNVPITVAGLGVREVSLVTFLSYYEVGVSDAISYSLLMFAMFICTALIGGFVELARYVFNAMSMK